jgi:hypothetical protein
MEIKLDIKNKWYDTNTLARRRERKEWEEKSLLEPKQSSVAHTCHTTT